MSDENRVAIVTGSARGIGAAVATRFLREKFTVIGLDTGRSTLGPAERYEFHACDVANEPAVEALVGDVARRHGRIDVLVNVAGVVLVKPLTDTRWEEFQNVVNINVGGTFLLMKHVLPIMQIRKRGVIINMASVSAHVGQIDHGLYGASKAAIVALCRSLAWELAPYNIRINSVSPGSVDTPMLRGDIAIESQKTGVPLAEVKAKREAEQALGRWAEPCEIAAAVYFLASDESSFVTGTDLLVDCGWTAR
jgi:NAD(P)-dependent dehydrogenase (short-subunit alcohol dehydrogenase family)